MSGRDVAIIVASIVGIFGIIVMADYVQVTKAAEDNPLTCIKGTFFEGNHQICRLQEAIIKYMPLFG